MASFHLAGKAIGRSAGRSATAAAAYRAGVEITDERTGLVHDYTRKQGVEHSDLMLPTDAPEWAADRERLWNAAEPDGRASVRAGGCPYVSISGGPLTMKKTQLKDSFTVTFKH